MNKCFKLGLSHILKGLTDLSLLSINKSILNPINNSRINNYTSVITFCAITWTSRVSLATAIHSIVGVLGDLLGLIILKDACPPLVIRAQLNKVDWLGASLPLVELLCPFYTRGDSGGSKHYAISHAVDHLVWHDVLVGIYLRLWAFVVDH